MPKPWKSTVLSNPLTSLLFPLFTTCADLLDQKDWDRENSNKFIKRPALLGSTIGAGIGIALCTPDGLISVMGTENVNKLSDLFNQGGFNSLEGQGMAHPVFLDDLLNVLLCILAIAACSIFLKIVCTEVGVKLLNNKLAEQYKISAGFGLAYGFFGDSVDDFKRLKHLKPIVSTIEAGGGFSKTTTLSYDSSASENRNSPSIANDEVSSYRR
jgi:hypothetical protein